MKVKQQKQEQKTAIYHDNHNVRIFRVSPFFKLQNKLNKSWTVKNGMYSTYLLFVGCFVVLVFNARNNQAINFLTEMSPMSPMPYTGLPQEVTVRPHMPSSSQIPWGCYKKWIVEWESQTKMCRRSTFPFQSSCGCTALDMLEWREMIEQIDWRTKQPSQVAWFSEDFKYWEAWDTTC